MCYPDFTTNDFEETIQEKRIRNRPMRAQIRAKKEAIKQATIAAHKLNNRRVFKRYKTIAENQLQILIVSFND